MAYTVNIKRLVAADARAFATANGIEGGHGSRGRVSSNVVFQFLQGSKPATVREIAGLAGFEVPAKGSIKVETLGDLAVALTSNGPKVEAGE
jgi:hypothetical protein